MGIMLRKGMREIRGRKVLYLLLALTIGIGVGLYGAMNNMVDARAHDLDQVVEENRFMDLRVRLLFDSTVDLGEAEGIMSSPSIAPLVEGVEHRLTFDVLMNETTAEGWQVVKGKVFGHDLGTEGELEVNRLLFYQDDVPSLTSGDCYLERNHARSNGIEAGDAVTVLRGGEATELEVLAHVHVPEYLAVIDENDFLPTERSFGVVCVTLEEANAIMGAEGRVNDIAITLAEGTTAEGAMAAIEGAFSAEGYAVEVTGREANPAWALVKGDIEGDRGSINLFVYLVLGISVFALAITFVKMVRTHRAEIGVFKALGTPNSVIVSYYIAIAAIVAIASMVIGVALGLVLHRQFEAVVYDLYFDMPVQEFPFFPRHYLIGGAISLVICMASALVPALMTVRLAPVDAIQKKEGLMLRAGGRTEEWLARFKGMPMALKVPLRNMARARGRTLTMVMGIGISMALFLAFSITLDSYTVILDDSKEFYAWDYEVTLTGLLDEGVAREIGAIDPSMEAVPALRLGTVISNGDREVDALLSGVTSLGRSYAAAVVEGEFVEGVSLSRYHAEELGVGVGDVVDMTLPLRVGEGLELREVAVPVASVHDAPLGTFAFIPLAHLQGITSLDGAINTVHLLTDGPLDSVAEAALVADANVASLTVKQDVYEQFDRLFELANTMILMILLLGLVLAVAVVYNIIMTNIIDRRREYATMRAMGMDMGGISRLVVSESLLLGAMGIAMGLFLGFLIGYYIVVGRSDLLEGFVVSVVFQPEDMLLGSLTILGAVALVSLMGIRRVRDMDVADIIRERSI